MLYTVGRGIVNKMNLKHQCVQKEMLIGETHQEPYIKGKRKKDRGPFED